MQDETFQIPRKLGKFEIMSEIGRGNMAIVYLANDPFMNRQVAVKVAMPQYLRDKNTGPMFRKMFFNEARVAGMLDNRFILPVYDAGIDGDLLYIVMENVRGADTLKTYCAKDNLLPIPKVLEIVYKCCRGLDYAHSRDVIHRDIKPTNILLTEEMDVRIADFGIAQLVRGEETQMVGMMGSPRYMSPEQVSELPLTPQSDLFSLGVVLYELLAGQPPFNGTTLPALTNQIMNVEPPMLKTLRSDAPDYLEVIIKRALAKRPEARYPKGMDFANDLLLAHKHQAHIEIVSDTTHQEKFRRLKATKFFSEFFDSEINDVIEHSEWGEYDAGEIIISEGDIDDSFYVIINGTVDVLKGDMALSTLRDGDCFGEMGFFSKTSRTASIVATTDVMLVKINSTRIEKVSMGCQLKFMKVFLKTLIERLSMASTKIAKAESGNR